MAVTRSTVGERTTATLWRVPGERRYRSLEAVLLVLCTVFAVAAIALTAKARLTRAADTAEGSLNLSRLEKPAQLLPLLPWISSATERQYVATKIVQHVQDTGSLSQARDVGSIRVPIHDILRTRGLPELQARAKAAQAAHPQATTIALLTGEQMASLRPVLVVREAAEYRRTLLLWAAVFVLGFWLAHAALSFRGSQTAPYVLPSLFVLSSLGLCLMITLRDPLRDSLIFENFSQGAALGCVGFAVASAIDYRRAAGKLSYVFLLLSFLLSAALIVFGTGPAGSDAKIRFLGFQPAEVIRILIVFFLAGYFAQRWEFLRSLRDDRAQLEPITRWAEVPRLEYLVPVVAGVVLCLVLFFLQKDLGPALLIACLFLAMYAVARDRYLLATLGLAVILSGFATGYYFGFPGHVAGRVSMWLSPWDNATRGGEQVAQSLWGFASGGVLGSGAGLGDPQVMPAAHTDLILAALGEEWGLIGVLCVFCLYAVIVFFGLRTALRARSDYTFFLALGLSLALALQVALIAGGVLDLLPLSGVVLPFLSYGRTALITNFLLVGILCGSAQDTESDADHTEPFRASTRGLSYVLAGTALLLMGKAAYIQGIAADKTAGAGALALQADGARRFEYNPRLLAIARSIPRGTIYDRSGIPLATSDWNELQKFRTAYESMGLQLPPESAVPTRYYPLGAKTVHLLGDLRSRANWGAPNSSLAERDHMVALQGFDDSARVVQVSDPKTGTKTATVRYDYRELLPLLRHRWQPDNPAVRKVRDRKRDLHMSIDANLQLKAADLLESQLRKLGKERGAVVILDASSGDLLASVSYPLPQQMPPSLDSQDSETALLDRARYGLFPPGSSFKLVTSVAALRKDPHNAESKYECRRLPDGRVGNFVRGWQKPIQDDIRDTAPHGNIDMREGLVVSCNAYFAQLGTYVVGPQALLDTANLFGISVANPATVAKLRGEMPQASYGQGQVVASPFQMARVAATLANGGSMPFGRWITDENNTRTQAPQAILPPPLASEIARSMREVVTRGTGRSANAADVAIAGKTGTAELQNNPSHAWFVGFAPYDGPRKLAFAVLIENGQYGGTAAAPLALELMRSAKQFGYFQDSK